MPGKRGKRLGNEPLPPKGYADPVARLGLVGGQGEVARRTEQQADAAATRPVARSSRAYTSSCAKTVRMISRLSSTLRCGGQSAAGPTRGSRAYSYRSAASASCHGLSLSRAVVSSIRGSFSDTKKAGPKADLSFYVERN